MLLVRSIDEIPQPIAYKTHNAGLRMVQDLSVARRFIMQKLAVGMLNIVDQFHTEVRNLMFDSHALMLSFELFFFPVFQLELAHIFYCILNSLL
jgi:hypothetical protein